MPRPIVAIVGRPNVGKSSLFNRIIGKRQAVVDPMPGVTRDRIMAEAQWNNREFFLVDTGGVVPGTTDKMELSITEQAQLAIDEAAVILFLTDVQTGVTDLDQEIARMLRATEKPVVVVVNKVDSEVWEADWLGFFALGLGDPVPVSSMAGRRVGDMLDEIVKALPRKEDDEGERTDGGIAVALIGRPNVGKSSLVNALVGSQAVVVDKMPGTTRDSTDTPIERDGRKYTLIDTAGLRRQKVVWRSQDAIEYYSTLRTVRALERCQIAVVVVDGAEHVVAQDLGILSSVHKAGKGMVVVVNKWDLVPNKTTETPGVWVNEFHHRFPFAHYLPVIFTSAETGQRVTRILDEADRAYTEWTKRVKTSDLNEWLSNLNRTIPPPASKQGVPKVSYVTQVSVAPPVFVFFVNDPRFISDQTERYLERTLREQFGFNGTPIRLKFKKKGRDRDSGER